MDKNRTQELIVSSRLILIGMIFWVIKLQYFTFFWLPENAFFANIGFEILGTIVILTGIIIIYRIYPFIDSIIAKYMLIAILLLNAVQFFLYNNIVFRQIHSFVPVMMSLVLFIITKLMKHSLRYFSNDELSAKWDMLGNTIFFGFSIPFYIFIAAHICNLIKYDTILKPTVKILFLFIPIGIIILIFFIYFIRILFSTLKFLNLQKNKK